MQRESKGPRKGHFEQRIFSAAAKSILSPDGTGATAGAGAQSPLQETARRIYVSHWDMLVSVAQRALFSHSREYARDVVAEIISDVGCGRFRSLPAGESQALLFIKGAIRNRASHVNRFERRLVSLGDEEIRDAYDPWCATAHVFLTDDIARALESLTRRERQVAALHWIGEWSTVEIADSLRISPRTVKELLRRARRTLRVELSSHSEIDD